MLLAFALGGVIAYFADRLGRTLGKKRLSLFGMRPRHTAEFLTVCAGAIIPLVTIGLVMIADRPVREWLLHGPELLNERDHAIADRDKANSELASIQTELTAEQKELNTEQSKVSLVQSQLAELNVKNKNLQAQLTQGTEKLGAVTAQYQTVQARYTTVNGKLVQVTQNYSEVKDRYAKVHKQFGDLNSKYATLNNTYKQLQTTYEVLYKQRDEAYQKVVEATSQLSDARKQLDSLNGQVASQKTALAGVQSDYLKAQNELKMVEDQLQRTRTVAQLYSSQNAQLANSFVNTRLRTLAFGVGDELSRVPVPAGLSETEARALIRQVLSKASEVAREKGATRGKDGAEAGLVDLPAERNTITINEQVDACMRALAGSDHPKVLLATSFYNSFDTEFVPVVLSVYNNPLVYRRNQTIADTTIQGSSSADQIFEQISAFVKDKVQQRAKEDNMIPLQGKDASFGEITPGSIIALVQQIRSYGRSVHLYAYASQDTYAADPLDLKFGFR